MYKKYKLKHNNFYKHFYWKQTIKNLYKYIKPYKTPVRCSFLIFSLYFFKQTNFYLILLLKPFFKVNCSSLWFLTNDFNLNLIRS